MTRAGQGRGGNWELEMSTGAVQALPVFDVQKLAGYDHLPQSVSASTPAELLSYISGSGLSGGKT